VLGGKKGARRPSFRLAAMLAISAAVPAWSQSLPSNTQSPRITYADGPQVTEESSAMSNDCLGQTEEDRGALCLQAIKGDDFWGPLKYVRLGRSLWYVSFGADLRGSYEVYRNYNWGSGPQDRNGYYLNRVIGHADFHFGQSVRVFAELQSGLEFGRNGGPRPAIDEDKLDVSQLFLELRSSTHRHRVPIAVRIGRQDLNYGDGSLVSIRDLNVRRPFDGIKLVLLPETWSIDVFAAKPVVTTPGFFDDPPDHTQTFWGIWATHKNEQSSVRQLDFYYLGLDRKNAQFEPGTARERRNTVGFNAHEMAGRFTLLQEGDLQFGTFGSGQLLAWKLAQGVAYSLPRVRYRPTLEFQGAISSGDQNPENAGLQTFYPLFPSGIYYGDMVFTSGSLNAIVAHPSLEMQLSKSLSLDFDNYFLWRQTTTDGLYSQAGMFLRSGQTSSSSYIGATQDLSFAWRLDRHMTLRFVGAYFEVGPYLRETPPSGKDATYFSVTANYKF
jgi:Alginate export